MLIEVVIEETPGIGTVSNIVLISLAIDVMQPFIPEQSNLFPQLIQSLIGIIFVAIGSAFYLTANLGPGPRDGWMTGIQKRTDWPIGRVRAGIEISVLSVGTFLGGIFGLGTIMFAIGIGPILAICLGFVKKWSI